MARKRRTPDDEIRVREHECIRLRRTGMTFDEIAIAVGYANSGGAQKAYERGMGRLVHDDVKAERARMMDQLDMMLNAHWARSMAGNPDHTNTVLRVLERRARLLGLDMPIRTELTVTVWDTANEEGRELVEIYERLAALETVDLIAGVEGALAQAAGGSPVLEHGEGTTGAAPA